jgi:replicative DNA helicase
MKAVISIILNNGKAGYDEAVKLGIEKKHFIKDVYRVIWDAFTWISEDGSSMNKVTVRKCLEVNNTLKYISIDGKHDDVLLDIRAFAKNETIESMHTFARMLLDEYALNMNKEMATQLLAATTSGQQAKIIEKFSDTLYAGNINKLHTALDVINDILEKTEKSQVGIIDTMKTRLPVLSKYLNMTPTNQTVIAGDTGQGKSSLALQLVEDLASQTTSKIDKETGRLELDENFNEILRHRVILFFALEMTRDEIVYKIYCSRNNINFDMIYSLPKAKFLELGKKAREYIQTFLPNLIIVDESDMNLNGIQKYCARVKMEYGYLDAVIVDHIGLLEEIYMSSADETRQYKFVSRYMKMKIAKKYNTHTILISQLNKAFTGKDGMTNHLPSADRLFGSGTKQDATNIIFVYWEKIIGKQTIQVGADKNVSSHFVTKIIIGKSRFGATVSPKAVGWIPYIQRIVPFEFIEKWNLKYAKDDGSFILTDEQLEEVLQF